MLRAALATLLFLPALAAKSRDSIDGKYDQYGSSRSVDSDESR